MLQDRGALPEEEGEVVREYKGMHVENFLSSWLREDGKNKEEIIMDVDTETKKRDRQKEGKRRGERRERGCVNSVSTEAFEIFGQEEIPRVVVILGVLVG